MPARLGPKISQTAALLIFLAVAVLAGPGLYVNFVKATFIVSPDWWSRFAIPTFIGSAVLALLSFLVFLRLAKSYEDKKQRWSLIIMGPLGIAALVFWFVRMSLPIMLSQISPQATSYEMTVRTTQREGKVRCDYPFSIQEISETFCATSADAYGKLRPGSKIEVFGKGNQWGMFVEGYRLLAGARTGRS